MSTALTKAPLKGGSLPAGRELVFQRGWVVFANSVDVAAYFGKRHDHVLSKIRELIDAGCAPHFRATSAEVAMPNGGSRSEASFDMDRDGFTLLAMGFTGQKALTWKLKYVQAFNAMEAELRAQSAPRPEVFDVNDNTQLLALVNQVGNALLIERQKTATLTVEKAAVEAKVEQLEPKALAWQRIADSHGLIVLTDFAKAAQVKRNWLINLLLGELNWCYRRKDDGPVIARYETLEAEFMAHRLVEYTRTRPQAYLTPKGAAELAKLIEERRKGKA